MFNVQVRFFGIQTILIYQQWKATGLFVLFVRETDDVHKSKAKKNNCTPAHWLISRDVAPDSVQLRVQEAGQQLENKVFFFPIRYVPTHTQVCHISSSAPVLETEREAFPESCTEMVCFHWNSWQANQPGYVSSAGTGSICWGLKHLTGTSWIQLRVISNINQWPWAADKEVFF